MERREGLSSVLAVVRVATAALVLGLLAIAKLTLDFRSEVRSAQVVILSKRTYTGSNKSEPGVLAG